MDGTTAGNGPGPRTMFPVVKDYMLASEDQVAIDAISAKMMGFDPMSLDYIRLADEAGLGNGRPENIEIVGPDVSNESSGFHFAKNLLRGIAAYTGWGKVASALTQFSWGAAGIAFALAATDYLLRFAKWELYLRRLGVRIPTAHSLQIFLSGFALTVTPGKVGEVLKSYLLRESHGIPMARTAPTGVAGRPTDLLACVALGPGGVGPRGGKWLPGGVGVQEGGVVALLVSTAHGVGAATAAAATFITRLCTLWFAVAVGLGALSLLRRPVDLHDL